MKRKFKKDDNVILKTANRGEVKGVIIEFNTEKNRYKVKTIDSKPNHFTYFSEKNIEMDKSHYQY